MPWMSDGYSNMEWPTKLHAKIIRSAKPKIEDILEVLSKAQQIYTKALYMEARITNLESEILKLKQENAFLTKEIDYEK